MKSKRLILVLVAAMALMLATVSSASALTLFVPGDMSVEVSDVAAPAVQNSPVISGIGCPPNCG